LALPRRARSVGIPPGARLPRRHTARPLAPLRRQPRLPERRIPRLLRTRLGRVATPPPRRSDARHAHPTPPPAAPTPPPHPPAPTPPRSSSLSCTSLPSSRPPCSASHHARAAFPTLPSSSRATPKPGACPVLSLPPNVSASPSKATSSAPSPSR